MRTSNDLIYDGLVRQQINLQRLSKGEAQKLFRMLDAADKELNALITERLAKITVPDFTTARWMAMEEEISSLRGSVLNQIESSIDESMSGVVKFALDDTKSLVEAAVPVEINFAMPPIATVRELARSRPFGGADMVQSMGEWMKQLSDVDKGRIMGALKSGIMGGEDIARISRRVASATGMTRQNAEAISRTSINHASNVARDEIFKENEDVILALRWVSTLDGRTSSICRARDGMYDSIEGDGTNMEDVPKPHIQGSPRRPPAHLKCRSVMIAILDKDGIADMERPFVADKRTRDQREKDFRAQAKEKAGDRWSGMSREERNDMIREERKEWTRTHVGTVSSEMTYDQWLRQQTPELQDQVLGKTKGEAFRNGASVREFVDKDLNILTIDELYDTIPEMMPPRKPSLAGPGTPSAAQMTKEAKRREKLERDRADRAEREKRAAEKKAKELERRAETAEKKASKEASAAAKSDKAAELAMKKKAAAEAEAAQLKKEAKAKQLEKAREAKKAKAEAKKAEEAKKLLEEKQKLINTLDAAKKKAEEQLEALAEEEIEKLAQGVESKLASPDSDARLAAGVKIQTMIEQRILEGNPDISSLELTRARRRELRKIIPFGEDPAKYQKWLDSLDDDDLAAFWEWTKVDGHKLMRDAQRGRIDDVAALARAKRIEDALARAPGFTDPIYRGSAMSKTDLKRLKVGQVLSEDALSAFSFVPDVADDYALNRAFQFKREPIVFRVDSPKHAVNITHFGNAREGEVLVSSIAKYEIVSVEKVVRVSSAGVKRQVTEIVLRPVAPVKAPAPVVPPRPIVNFLDAQEANSEAIASAEKAYRKAAKKVSYKGTDELIREHRRALAKVTPPTENPLAYQKWIDSLTDEEFDAFYHWSREYNPKIIRDWQRGRVSPDSIEWKQYVKSTGQTPARTAELMESAMARAPQFQGTVYRGGTYSTTKTGRLPFKVGDVLSERALASGTYDPTVASSFATVRAREFDKLPVIYKIENVKSGAVNIQNMTDTMITHEAEIGISSKLRFEVVAIRKVKGAVDFDEFFEGEEFAGFTGFDTFLEVVLRVIE